MSAETVESGAVEEKAPRVTSKTIIAELRRINHRHNDEGRVPGQSGRA